MPIRNTLKKRINSILNTRKLKNKKVLTVLYIVFCAVIIIYMSGLVTNKPITSDAQQNLRMAYHLYKHNVLSKAGETSAPSPTNYREPVPPIVTAFFMYVHPGIDKDAPLASFENGENTPRVKQVNFIWIFFLLTGIGLLTFLVSRNRYLPFLSLIFVFVYFIRFGNHFDVMLTELPGTTFLIWTTVFLILAFKNQDYTYYALTGICLGFLILTKGVFFYLSVVVALFVFFFVSHQKKLQKTGLFLAGVILLVAPWMIRNYMLYSDFSITQRGGVVLYIRALQDQMTGEEIIGAVYHWGPEIYQDAIGNTALGATDEDFEKGGKYSRISRAHISDSVAIDQGRTEEIESFYLTARAEVNRLQAELGSDTTEASKFIVYNIMEEDAKEMILSNPIKHTLMSGLFLWRGIWCFPSPTIPLVGDSIQNYIHNIINFIAYVSLFGFFFVGVYRKDMIYIALTLLPVAMLTFHALIAQNIPRMSETAIPSMLICLTLLIYLLIERYQKRLVA